MSGERCACGYAMAEVEEGGRCVRCGAVCCTQCAYVEEATCTWYCHACARRELGVASRAGEAYGRVYEADVGTA